MIGVRNGTVAVKAAGHTVFRRHHMTIGSATDDLRATNVAPGVDSRPIRSVEITKGPGPLPAGIFEQAPRVIATLDDGSSVEVFSFYANERSFTTEEFVGLTVDAARGLKFQSGRGPSRSSSALER
jgi:hypothetical protein